MRGHVIGLLITALWVVMMSLLVRDHLLPRSVGANAEEITPSRLAERWRDVHDFMLLRQGDQTLGATVLTVERDRETGTHRVTENLQVNLLTTSARLRGAATLGAQFELDRFWVELQAGPVTISARGQVVGEALTFEINTPTGRRVFTQPLGAATSLLDAIRPSLFETVTLEPGASYRIRGADLFGSFAVADFTIEVLEYDLIETARGTIAAHRVATDFGGVVTTSWVDEMGQLVRQQLWGDVYLERAGRAQIDEAFPHLLDEVALPAFDLTDASATAWGEADASLFSLRHLTWGGAP